MADDIIPLRHSYALSMVERISELEAEIERLRVDTERADAGVAWLTSKIGHMLAAGDALHDAIRSHNLTEAHLKTWEEARRG